MATRKTGLNRATKYPERTYCQHSTLILPAWAQAYIASLHSQVERSETRATTDGWKPIGKRPRLGAGLSAYGAHGMREQLMGPEGSDVFIRTKDGEFEMREVEEGVEVFCYTRADLAIKPSCANVFRLVSLKNPRKRKRK